MARKLLPWIVGGGALLVAGVAFASSGDDEPGKLGPVEPPTDDEVPAIKEQMCTCYRGGATELDALVKCTLQIVYPDQDWTLLAGTPLEHVDDGTAQTVEFFRELAEEFLALGTDDERQQWCGEDGPPGPGPAPEPEPEPDDDGPTPPPPAPTYDPNLVHGEAGAVGSATTLYEQGKVDVPPGKSVRDHLTDVALKIAYPNAPKKIPDNWQLGFGWQPWVDAWERIYGMLNGY